MALTEDEIDLYSRQILVPAMGGRGQELLAAAKVQIIGEGAGLAFAASYLAGAGVGRIVWASGSRASPETALAPLDQRRPGGGSVSRPGVADADTIFDVLITGIGPQHEPGAAPGAATAPASSGATDSPLQTAQGPVGAPARMGEIGLYRGHPAGLLIVPARSGLCLACLDWPDAAIESPPGRRDAARSAIEDSLVGAMAALAALVWLAQLTPAETDHAQALLLAEGDWRRTDPSRGPQACPRCRQREI